jgi:hypothetical protein
MLDIPEQVCYNKYEIKRDYKIHKKEVMKNVQNQRHLQNQNALQ